MLQSFALFPALRPASCASPCFLRFALFPALRPVVQPMPSPPSPVIRATEGTSKLPPPREPAARAPSSAQGLTVLPWAGYRAAISYTFDDSNSSQIAHYDELNALGVPMTFYLWTGKTETQDPVWQRAQAAGHELGSHSHSHAAGGQELSADLAQASRILQSTAGSLPWTMAAPFGSLAYREPAQAHFFLNRGVRPGLILPEAGADPHDLPCYSPPPGASAAWLNERADAARAEGAWKIVLLHGFCGGTDDAYHPIEFAEFVRAVRYAQALGDLWLGSVVDIGAYWLGAQAVRTAVPERDGDSLRYRWDLPGRFPPGRSVRIATRAQAVIQDGAPLVASEFGTYDVSLDARSLRLRGLSADSV
jgi:peptidoglycan/xylan/chitin deacetylase (PgdA/CDA1 family)